MNFSFVVLVTIIILYFFVWLFGHYLAPLQNYKQPHKEESFLVSLIIIFPGPSPMPGTINICWMKEQYYNTAFQPSNCTNSDPTFLHPALKHTMRHPIRSLVKMQVHSVLSTLLILKFKNFIKKEISLPKSSQYLKDKNSCSEGVASDSGGMRSNPCSVSHQRQAKAAGLCSSWLSPG